MRGRIVPFGEDRKEICIIPISECWATKPKDEEKIVVVSSLRA